MKNSKSKLMLFTSIVTLLCERIYCYSKMLITGKGIDNPEALLVTFIIVLSFLIIAVIYDDKNNNKD